MQPSEADSWPYEVLCFAGGVTCQQAGMMRFALLRDADRMARQWNLVLGMGPAVIWKNGTYYHEWRGGKKEKRQAKT